MATVALFSLEGETFSSEIDRLFTEIAPNVPLRSQSSIQDATRAPLKPLPGFFSSQKSSALKSTDSPPKDLWNSSVAEGRLVASLEFKSQDKKRRSSGSTGIPPRRFSSEPAASRLSSQSTSSQASAAPAAAEEATGTAAASDAPLGLPSAAAPASHADNKENDVIIFSLPLTDVPQLIFESLPAASEALPGTTSGTLAESSQALAERQEAGGLAAAVLSPFDDLLSQLGGLSTAAHADSAQTSITEQQPQQQQVTDVTAVVDAELKALIDATPDLSFMLADRLVLPSHDPKLTLEKVMEAAGGTDAVRTPTGAVALESTRLLPAASLPALGGTPDLAVATLNPNLLQAGPQELNVPSSVMENRSSDGFDDEDDEWGDFTS